MGGQSFGEVLRGHRRGATVTGYSVQLALAVALLANTRSAALHHALVLVVVALYGSALGRTWEVTGITRRE